MSSLTQGTKLELTLLSTTGDVITDSTLKQDVPNMRWSLHALCTNQDILFCAGEENSIKSWKIQPDGLLAFINKYANAHLCAFHHNSTISALCCNDIMLFSAGNSTIFSWVFVDDCGTLNMLNSHSNVHEGSINALCTYAHILFSAGNDCSIKSWIIDGKGKLTPLQEYEMAHEKAIKAMTIYKNQLISISEDQILKVWEIQDDGNLIFLGSLFLRQPGNILSMCCTTGGLLVIKFLYSKDYFLIKAWQLEDSALFALISSDDNNFYREIANVPDGLSETSHDLIAPHSHSALASYKNTIFSVNNRFIIDSMKFTDLNPDEHQEITNLEKYRQKSLKRMLSTKLQKMISH